MKTKGMVAWIALIAMTMGSLVTPLHAENIEGNENLITKDIQIDDYTAIQIGNIHQSGGSFKSLFAFIMSGGNSSNSPKVYYKQGKETTLTVTTDENIFPVLTFYVKGNELQIQTKEGVQISPSKLVIETSSKDLNKLSIGGGTDFYLQSALDIASLDAYVSGGGNMEIKEPAHIKSASFSISGGGDLDVTQLTSEEVYVKVSGGGDANVAGKTQKAEMKVSGGGDLNAQDLQADHVICNVSGGGDATVYAISQLDAHASGGGDIRYKGNPKTDTSCSGGGDIHHIN